MPLPQRTGGEDAGELLLRDRTRVFGSVRRRESCAPPCCGSDALDSCIERMESGVFLNCLDQFMLSPLVTWVSAARVCGLTGNRMSSSLVHLFIQVKTLASDDGGEHLDFSDLLDGVFLNNIMAQL